MAHKAHTYADLLQQADLRLQHPEWIQRNGQCPMRDCYEARLIKLLWIPREPNDDLVAVSGTPTLPNAENSLAAIFS